MAVIIEATLSCTRSDGDRESARIFISLDKFLGRQKKYIYIEQLSLTFNCKAYIAPTYLPTYIPPIHEKKKEKK